MLKKLKTFYRNNRIYCILMIISFICILLMAIGLITYFAKQLATSKYGSRLEDIKEYPLNNALDDIKTITDEQEIVLNIKTNLEGKIIYIEMELMGDASNDDCHNIANATLEKLTDEQKGYYDIQYICKREDVTPYFGAKSHTKTIISWHNTEGVPEELA